MNEKKIWLLYDQGDLAVNRDYAAMMRQKGKQRGLRIEPVTLQNITLTMDENGVPHCLNKEKPDRPDAVLSRMRQPLYSRHLEAMGISVFNCAAVCEICNDKRRTHQFLSGLPMPSSRFLAPDASPPSDYPVIVKPACSHGGDRVTLALGEEKWRQSTHAIWPEAALEQKVVSVPGRDLRVYILFEKIVAAVMRTARNGVVSNFKLGGGVELHPLEREERQLAQEVIDRFHQAGAPLHFAGVDLLYESYGPVVGEVEDVVGSRMLYQTSDIDVVAMLLEEIAAKI